MRINNNLNTIVNNIKNQYFCCTSILGLGENTKLSRSKQWKKFHSSWNNLSLDTYMGDNGQYRYRRYTVLTWDSSSQKLTRELQQPHFQKTNYNTLNGGIYRHYEPFEDYVAGSSIFKDIINHCITIFNIVNGKVLDWYIEAHQFRIIAVPGTGGLPTPEGIHRDGVHYVFIMMIKKENVKGGRTSLYNMMEEPIYSLTLENSFDCIFTDDTMLMHYVSPILPLDDSLEAYRDVLVLTFQKRSIA
jgi:hypothetical protein